MADLASAGLLLPPALRARLNDLELRARRAAIATGFGQQHSRSRGPGSEFAHYRGYEPGDEPRSIDWKLYARSDKHFVREAERDSPLTVWIVLDATASMTQADPARPDWTRLHAARRLAACVIEVALRQSDSFGVAAISGGGIELVPAAAGPRQRDRCLLQLARLHAQGAWPEPAQLAPLWARIGADALVLWLSDDFDEAAIETVERLASAGREVVSLGLLTVAERDFPLSGAIRFVDPETHAVREADAASLRSGFLARFGAARRELAGRFAACGVAHVDHVLDRPEDEPLRALFGAEARRRGSRGG